MTLSRSLLKKLLNVYRFKKLLQNKNNNDRTNIVDIKLTKMKKVTQIQIVKDSQYRSKTLLFIKFLYMS